jgi:hypothetical protein
MTLVSPERLRVSRRYVEGVKAIVYATLLAVFGLGFLGFTIETFVWQRVIRWWRKLHRWKRKDIRRHLTDHTGR